MKRQERERVMRSAEVCRLTGLTPSTLSRYRRAGNFPPPRQLGPRRVGWLKSDVEKWLASRPQVPLGHEAMTAEETEQKAGT